LPAEALALALALGAPGEPILRYLTDLKDTRLDITGDDLIAAGVAESPAIGRALEETLRRKLDGEVAGRDEELRLALSLAKT
jgi:tRNA nucleotidyltransferase (CCA-adding enzyme)